MLTVLTYLTAKGDFMLEAEKGTSRRIREAAKKIISEEGMEALSMRKLGKAVGLSQAAVYRHYRDKEALILAVVGEGYTGIVAILESIAASASSTEDFFRKSLRGYVEWALSDPAMFKALALRDAGPAARQVNSLSPGVSAKRETFRILVAKLEEGMADGSVAKGDPEHLAQVLWMWVFGIASRLVLEPEIPPQHREKLIVNAGMMISRSLRPERAEEDSRAAAKERGQ